ncbi:MAG: hypothetical protein AAGD10_18330 [Myxococcota bacterium]
MRSPIPLAMLGFCLVVLAPPSASARSTYVIQIPNAPNSCNTCHQFGGGTPRNVFGLDVEATLSGGAVDWSAIFALDSDNDGYTNGQELADPNGEWTRGDSRPDGNTSFPGDSNSTLCDNGTLELDFGETCDLDDFGGETCESQGFAGGALSCEGCRISTTGCNDGMEDMGTPDMGPADTGVEDLGAPADMGSGSGEADAGVSPAPHAGVTAPSPGGEDEGDGCQGVTASSLLWLLLPFGLRRRRSCA